MRRSYSQDYISKCIKAQEKKSPVVKELTGNLSKKVNHQRSALWNGLALMDQEPAKTIKQSPMRWKEYQSSRRTINPEFSNEPTRRPASAFNRDERNARNGEVASNLIQMINQGSTQEKIGKLNKKVVLKGKQVVKNAESTDSQLVSKGISKAYQGIHTGQVPVSRKPQIVITQMSKAKKTSQIYTLPAGPKEENEVKVLNKDRYEKNSKIIETTNPCIINKGKIDLSIEKEKLLLSFSSYYDKNPLSFDQTPSKQGKFRDSHSFSRMYQGLIVEKAPVSPKRRRPFDSKDMFKSSIVLC